MGVHICAEATPCLSDGARPNGGHRGGKFKNIWMEVDILDENGYVS